jgi:hypothetical protein
MRTVLRHDAAPAHYSGLVTRHLNLTFPEQWIGHGSHVQWPARSTDLTALDFCVWGWMKSEVYKGKEITRDELAARIMNSAAALKQERQDDLRTATLTVVRRVEKCTEVDGGIFEHLF